MVMSTVSEYIKPETLSIIETQAKNLDLSVDEYLRRLLPKDVQELGLKPDAIESEFEDDMIEFAEGTANLVSSNGALSREDIYFDHD